MRRVLLLLAIVIAVLSGCAGEAPAPPPGPEPPAPSTAEPAPPPARTQTPPPQQEPPAPPKPPEPTVRKVGEDLELTGLKNVLSVVWSPSGRRAVVWARPTSYLLDTAGPSLAPLAGFDPHQEPRFWSETDLLWMREGRLQIRDLASGQDRLLHDFAAPVIHFIRPGDTHYVVNREQGMVQQGYRFGAIVAGKLGAQEEIVLIETGHLIGRMSTGQVLAVEGLRGGPLWAFAPGGEKRLLSREPAYFVQLSPDGRRALWLTGSPPRSSWWRDLFRPAVAHADGPYDPPLTDLWTWDGAGDPVRIPLGGTYSARAEFSPDGSRIALALNEGFIGPERHEKPGRLAVVEDGKIRTLAAFDGWVGLGIWLDSQGFRFMPPIREKTGAQTPIFRMDLSGEQSHSTGMWLMAGYPDRDHLILNWRGDLFSTVHWRGAAEPARVQYNPSDRRDHPLYVAPSAPYLPFAGDSGLRLKPLQR